MQRGKIVGLTVGALLFVACFVIWVGQNAQAGGSYGPFEPRGGFGKAIAGTWLTAWQLPGIGEGTTITSSHADGQFTTTNTHGFQVIANAASDEHGTWVQTGPNSCVSTSVKFSLADQGDGTRALAWIVRIRNRTEFNETYDAAQGTTEIDYFPPGADVNLDDPLFTVTGGTFQGVRVAVVP